MGGAGEAEAVEVGEARFGAGVDHVELDPGAAGGAGLEHELLAAGWDRAAEQAAAEADRAARERAVRGAMCRRSAAGTVSVSVRSAAGSACSGSLR